MFGRDSNPPSAPLPPLVERHRIRHWIVAGAVAATALVGCDGELMHEAFNLQHDLLEADFTEDDGTFWVGETEDYRSEIQDDKYRLTAAAPSPPVPLETFGFFSRTAYNVDIQADIHAFDAPGAAIGLECSHSAGGGDAGERYVFLSTEEGYEIATVFDETPQLVASQPGPAVEAGQRLGLHCSREAITGLVDGSPVITWGDPSHDSFKAMALVFFPDGQGHWIEFDRVTSDVPEH